MTSASHSRARALSKAIVKHWRRVRAEPRLFPHMLGKAWRVLRGGRLDALVERNRLRTDWFSDYGAWVGAHERIDPMHFALLAERVRALPRTATFAVVVVAGANASRDTIERTLESLDGQIVAPVASAVIAASDAGGRGVRRYDEAGGQWAALRAAVNDIAADWIAIVDAGDELARDAIAHFALELAWAPDVALAYSDHDEVDDEGTRMQPDFKPCWDPYLFAQQPYLGRVWFARRKALAAALAGISPLSEWDLLWRIVEPLPPTAIAHLPRVLCHRARQPRAVSAAPHAPSHPPHAHFERRATAVEFESRGPRAWRLRFPLPSPAPRVSIVIPTRDQPGLLAAATDSVLSGTTYPSIELIVVDNGSVDAEALALLGALGANPRVRVIRDPAPFNFARLNNEAARHATGELLCFLNDDTLAIAPDWLDELASLALRDDAGVVGARLLYRDGTIQHSGVVLGAFALTHHLLQGRPADFRGYHDRGVLTHAVSCVTAACAVIRRELFASLGGFDENLPAAYNDVDLCLAALAQGRYNLVVNRPLLHHYESASRGYYYTPQQEAADRAALGYLLGKWGEGIRADPFYNPNLALDRENYTLAYPPRVPAEGALRVAFVHREAQGAIAA
jgi:GT2 family glycosyltransferase